MKTRKTYSKEFKLDAIALVREQNYSTAEVARNLEVTPQILGRWIKEAIGSVFTWALCLKYFWEKQASFINFIFILL